MGRSWPGAAMIASIDSDDITYDDLVSYYGLNYLKWQVMSEKLRNAVTDMVK